MDIEFGKKKCTQYNTKALQVIFVIYKQYFGRMIIRL